MLVGADTAHSLHSVVLSNPLKMFTQTGSKRGRHAVSAFGRSQCVRDPPSHQPFAARGWHGSRTYLRLVFLAAHAPSCRQTMPLESTRSLSGLRTKKLNCSTMWWQTLPSRHGPARP